MRGFFAGSLALIALYAVVSNTDNAGTALTATGDLLRRLVSSEVGGVPDRAGGPAQAPAASTPAPTSVPFNPVFAPYLGTQIEPTSTPA